MSSMPAQSQCTKDFCAENTPSPCGLIIFGASGDLANRKLLPALFALFQRDLLPANFYIVGCARTAMDDNTFREKVHSSIKTYFSNDIPKKMLNIFLQNVFYISGQYDSIETYSLLSVKLEEIEKSSIDSNPISGRIFYLATPVALYGKIVDLLGESGLVKESSNGVPWRRVVIEKPFGYDLESAQVLEKDLRKSLLERQVFRIDHYLGKETVQNILMFRFANTIFEPVWNNNYIDCVQITVAESIGIEYRAGYFDQTGLLRDMFQNHMLQMLSMVAMEPPVSFDADSVRDEKVKLLKSIRPFPIDELAKWIIRGQYGAGEIDGKPVPEYRNEEGVNPQSDIETYAAAKTLIDNWRWKGVPFYLRAGKRLAKRISEIAITFKKIPHSIFMPLMPEDLPPNVLVLNVQPEEGAALYIQVKRPGPKLCMDNLQMDFKYCEVFGGEPPEAYQRLLLDCMLGDHTLFIRNDTIEIAWSLLTPVLQAWKEKGNSPEVGKLHSYAAGSWGPVEADKLLELNGAKWR